jgi:hypothetical protein
MAYTVKDGYLMITSEESLDEELPGDPSEPPPILLKQRRAERGEMPVEELKEFVEELKLRKEMMDTLRQLRSVDPQSRLGGGTAGGAESLLKEVRELLGQIRDERAKAAGAR